MIASLTSLMKNKENRILNNVRIAEKEDKYGRYYELSYWLYNTEWKTRIGAGTTAGRQIWRDIGAFPDAKSFNVEIFKDISENEKEYFTINLEPCEGNGENGNIWQTFKL